MRFDTANATGMERMDLDISAATLTGFSPVRKKSSAALWVTWVWPWPPPAISGSA